MNFAKREKASDLLLILLISALSSLLITRFFLNLLGWPTISFGIWHIAHVNWGGLLMLMGMVLMLAVYGEKIRKVAAIIFGAGWGLFIDEVGKYVTKNNDYWFQPAVIIIYVSFIILFLVYRYLEKAKSSDPKTILYSKISELENINESEVMDDKKRKYLTMELKKIIKKIPIEKTETKSWWYRMIAKTGYFSYNKIFKRRIIWWGLIIFAGIWSINRIQETVRILTNHQRMELIQKFYSDYDITQRPDFYMISLKIISDSAAALFFLIGIYFWTRKKHQKGLRFFQLGLIVSIFLSSIFKLYFEQFSESIVIIASVFLLMAINRLKKET